MFKNTRHGAQKNRTVDSRHQSDAGDWNLQISASEKVQNTILKRVFLLQSMLKP